MSLLERLKGAGAIKATTLDKSKIFNDKDMIQTDVPIINVALSGALDGGMTSGLIVISAESKRFKSYLGLLMMRAYLNKYPDAVALFFDSEFGLPISSLAAIGIDPARVIHIPIENIEQLKFDAAKRLNEISRGDKVFLFVDSIGMLASKRESENALAEKDAEDMTRAKQLKSFFRIVNPHFAIKDITGVVINSVYKEMSLYPKDIVAGGQGITLACNSSIIITKSQEKDDEGLKGWHFTMNIEKSRFVKEKAKLTFLVTYDGGISRWSGLMDEALDSGHCTKPKNGWYMRKGDEKNYRLADTNNKDFWLPILKDKEFQDFVKNKYQLSEKSMFKTEDYDVK